jgi:hypothetical protein
VRHSLFRKEEGRKVRTAQSAAPPNGWFPDIMYREKTVPQKITFLPVFTGEIKVKM